MKSNYTIVRPTPSQLPQHSLCIRDIGASPSVTNSVEEIVKELFDLGYLTNGQRLFYFDSDNNLDELLVTKSGQFAGFKCFQKENRN